MNMVFALCANTACCFHGNNDVCVAYEGCGGYEPCGCANCKHSLSLERWDFSRVKADGWKQPQEGHVCDVFANEGKAVWMIGADDGICELWEVKDENKGQESR